MFVSPAEIKYYLIHMLLFVIRIKSRGCRKRFNESGVRHESVRGGFERGTGEIADRQETWKNNICFIGERQKLDALCGKINEELWMALLGYTIVYAKDDIFF